MITDKICKKMNAHEIKNNLENGYPNGDYYLSQTHAVVPNFKNFPESLLILKNLQVLSLRGGQFREMPKELLNFPKLRELDLSLNKIHTIPDWIERLNKLESIDLHGNELTTIPDTLLNLPNLQHIDLSYNNIDKEMIQELREKYKKKGVIIATEEE